MGYISDFSTIRTAFLVPLICHSYVLYFSLRGYQPVAASIDFNTLAVPNETGPLT
jgi:fucose permease